MADPDQTLVTDDEEDAPKPVGPSGTMVSDDAEPLPPLAPLAPESTVASPLMDPPDAQAPIVTRPMPELAQVEQLPTVTRPMPELSSPSRPPPYGGASIAVALIVTLVLAAAGGYAIVNADLEPAAPPPKPRVATPPPPRPAPAKPVEKKHERPVEVVMPSKPPPPGTVKIYTSPETRVSVEGKSWGSEPVTLTLPAGRNTIVLENPALPLRKVVTIEVKPNGHTEERFSFAKGWLRVAAPRGAKVSVDGKPMPPMNEVEVWEGLHRVDVVHTDKEATHESQIATVSAGKIAGVFFEPPRDGVVTTRAVMIPTKESRTRTTR